MAVSELAFAGMTGIVTAGIAASLLEAAMARPVSFAEPFLSRRRLIRSLLTAACAGPMMLANDALVARREGRISQLYLAFCAGTALAWATALGGTVVGLAVAAAAHLR